MPASRIYKMSVNFLIRGNLKIFDNGIVAGIVFKHPCFHYDNEKFKEWDCGYILGTILIMQDI